MAWGALAEEAAKVLKKGERVMVIGRYVTRSYEAKGAKQYVTELVANNIGRVLSTRQAQNGEIPF